MKNIIGILMLILFFNDASAQSTKLEWVNKVGAYYSETPNDVKSDAAGNVYVVGTFTGTVDFDPGVDTKYFVSSPSVNNGFIAKYDANGNLLWAKQIGKTNSSSCLKLAIDKNENVLVLGTFQGVVDFNPDSIQVFELHASINDNAFILKLNSAGEFINAMNINGDSGIIPYSIKLDVAENIIIAGRFSGNVDFDPGLNTQIITTANSISFILKLGSDGSFKWVINNDSYSIKYADIALDKNSSIYATGSFQQTVDMDPGPDSTKITAYGYNDILIVKLDSNGAFQWAKNYGGKRTDDAKNIDINANGDLFISGTFSDTAFNIPNMLVANTGNGGKDIFFAKLNNVGDIQWVKQINTSYAEAINYLKIDLNDNVYVCGYFRGNALFSSSLNAATYTSTDYNDMYVAKYNNVGDLIWVNQFEGRANCSATSLDINTIGEIYTVGVFKDTVNFEAGPSVYNLGAAVGGTDIFIHKMSQTPTATNDIAKNENTTIYPNPTNGILTIKTTNNFANASILVKNISGQQLKEMNNLHGQQIECDMVNFLPGIYFLELIEGNNRQVFKIEKTSIR